MKNIVSVIISCNISEKYSHAREQYKMAALMFILLFLFIMIYIHINIHNLKIIMIYNLNDKIS